MPVHRQRRHNRRSTLLLSALAAATVAVLIVGISIIVQHQRHASATAATTTPAVPGQAQLGVDFSKAADGRLPARIGNFPVTAIDAGRSAYGLTVTGGRLTHGSPLVDNAASYLQASMPTPVTRIGVSATFTPYSGDVALVVWQSALSGNGPDIAGHLPNAGIHFVAGEHHWELGLWQAGVGQVQLASGMYQPKGNRTGPQTFEVVRTGDSLSVILPDGRHRTVSDGRIATWTGSFPSWELYELQPGVAPAAINSIWAS